jgi:hypothetical protein
MAAGLDLPGLSKPGNQMEIGIVGEQTLEDLHRDASALNVFPSVGGIEAGGFGAFGPA